MIVFFHGILLYSNCFAIYLYFVILPQKIFGFTESRWKLTFGYNLEIYAQQVKDWSHLGKSVEETAPEATAASWRSASTTAKAVARRARLSFIRRLRDEEARVA